MTIDPDRYERFPSLIPVKEDVLRALHDAATNSDSPLRIATVGNVDPSGAPQLRSMVVRSFDEAIPQITFFTDARSPKVMGLEQNPRVQILMYDPLTHMQLRTSGVATLHIDDDLTARLWSDLPEYGRGDYLSRQPPGEQIAHPDDSWEDKTLGGRNFTVVSIKIVSVDWLKLSGQGHRRALLTWDNGNFTGRWVTP